MNSAPPTPPPTGIKGAPRRFEGITSLCESIDSYSPGGYHPVNLGDIVAVQYKVIRKLGHGSSSTVWLAVDLKGGGYVALKILMSDPPSTTTKEAQILRHLQKVAPQETRYMTQLLKEIEHHGPNGVHTVLAFEAMGPDVNGMVEELPQFNPRTSRMKVRYPLRIAKTILKQSLQALEFLHKNGIAHGDLQPGNMLFALRDNFNSVPAASLLQKEDVKSGSITPQIKRLDGKKDKWAPQYLCVPQSLMPFIAWREEGLKIKLTDMGSAYFFSDPPAKLTIPRDLRPPETIINGFFNNTSDIWCFGCLIFELITGKQLFRIKSPDLNDANDTHLIYLTSLLGPLPIEIFQDWKNSWHYFTPDRHLYNCRLRGVPDGQEPIMVEQFSLEQMFDQAKLDISQEEAKQITKLIRWILQYDHTKRPSATEILNDPWFREIEVDVKPGVDWILV